MVATAVGRFFVIERCCYRRRGTMMGRERERERGPSTLWKEGNKSMTAVAATVAAAAAAATAAVAVLCRRVASLLRPIDFFAASEDFHLVSMLSGCAGLYSIRPSVPRNLNGGSARHPNKNGGCHLLYRQGSANVGLDEQHRHRRNSHILVKLENGSRTNGCRSRARFNVFFLIDVSFYPFRVPTFEYGRFRATLVDPMRKEPIFKARKPIEYVRRWISKKNCSPFFLEHIKRASALSTGRRFRVTKTKNKNTSLLILSFCFWGWGRH